MAMLDIDHLAPFLPPALRRRISTLTEAAGMAREVHSGWVLAGMMPSVARGMLLELGRTRADTPMASGHAACFRWDYDSDFPELRALYRKAKQSQWDADTAIDWSCDVDPMNPERPLIPLDFFDVPGLAALGVRLDEAEQRRFTHSMAAWMLSQFLHGEQGALYAAAQITEAVGWMDAKLYGATQVMDEGRHLETFHRYLAEKLDKIYVINDNLFVILDALMTDPRWDVKFLGMQIMVEGLALGAFGTLYRITKEPLLRQLLGYVIRDEARHVTFGVHALRRHFAELDEAERREREDWAFEVALLMRNRFLAHEVFEEWFEGRIRRTQWNALVSGSPGMREFRSVMFARMVPNLRTIGLLSERMRRHYADAGLLQYYDGADALAMGGDELLASLDRQPPG